MISNSDCKITTKCWHFTLTKAITRSVGGEKPIALPLTKRREMTKILGALDVGNANVKLKLLHPDDGEKLITIQSALTILHDAEDDNGAFSYVGSNLDWCPKHWIPIQGDSHTWVMDTADGKPKLSLPLLLTAIHDHIEDGDHLDLVVSIHNVDALGDRMISALTGDHVFQRVGDKPKLLSVYVHKVLSEGVGALMSASPQTPNNWLLDIGGDTAIGTPYLQLKIRHGCNPYPLAGNGTRRLISEFSKCKAVSRAIATGRVLSYEASRRVIDDPKHVLTVGKDKHSLKDAVAEEVDRWLEDVVLKVERSAGHHLFDCDARIATGGACLIPEVARSLKERGYQIAPNPLTASVDGMLTWLARSGV